MKGLREVQARATPSELDKGLANSETAWGKRWQRTSVLVAGAGEDAGGPGLVLWGGEFEGEREAAVWTLGSVELQRKGSEAGLIK